MVYLGEDGQIPFISKNEIVERVNELLDEYWDGFFPVDVEKICDCLGIAILPVTNLSDNFLVDAFISADFKTIFVDAEEYEHESHRYWFSVAHEVGHYVLHREYFSNRVENFDEWRGISYGTTNHFAEFQANFFAGCLLAPEDELTRVLNKSFGGSFARNYWNTSRERLEGILMGVRKFFKVSEQVVDRRMRDLFYGLQ